MAEIWLVTCKDRGMKNAKFIYKTVTVTAGGITWGECGGPSIDILSLEFYQFHPIPEMLFVILRQINPS